jgi:hypothetical protein
MLKKIVVGEEPKQRLKTKANTVNHNNEAYGG